MFGFHNKYDLESGVLKSLSPWTPCGTERILLIMNFLESSLYFRPITFTSSHAQGAGLNDDNREKTHNIVRFLIKPMFGVQIVYYYKYSQYKRTAHGAPLRPAGHGSPPPPRKHCFQNSCQHSEFLLSRFPAVETDGKPAFLCFNNIMRTEIRKD